MIRGPLTRVRESLRILPNFAVQLTEYLAVATSQIDVEASAKVKCFNVPFPSNARHVSRSILCSEVCKQLLDGNPPRRVVLHGMGGIGKTEIALAIAVQQRESCHVFWVDCRGEIEMINNYKSIQRLLAQPSSDPSTAEVKAILSGRNDWLLIFDNVDDDSTLSIIRDQLLPPGELGQVLFTGRLSSLRAVGHAIEVPLLDIQESQLLLKKCCPSFPILEDAGSTLISLLGHLPLAIEQAGMYMEVNCIQISEYLEEISEPLTSKASLLGEGPASPYSRPLSRTWEMAFARISEDAKIVLNILGFLRPDGVDEHFFKSSTDHKADAPWSSTNSLQDFDRGVRLPDDYAHSLASPAIFRAAVNSLLRLSLIKRSQTKKLSMHPV